MKVTVTKMMLQPDGESLAVEFNSVFVQLFKVTDADLETQIERAELDLETRLERVSEMKKRFIKTTNTVPFSKILTSKSPDGVQ